MSVNSCSAVRKLLQIVLRFLVLLCVIVKPLFKKLGLDINSPSNYRKISNLNNISIILEPFFSLSAHLSCY